MKKILITLIIGISLMFIPKVYAYDVDYTQHNTIMASAWLDLGLGGNVGPLQVSANYPTGAWYGTAQNYTFTSPGLSEQEGPFKMAFVYSAGNPCGSNSGYIKGELSLWQNNDFSSRVSRVYLKNSNNEELTCNYTALSSAVIQYECSFGRSGFTSLEAEFGIDLQTGVTMVGRPIYSRGTSYACNSGTDTTTIENNQQTIINQNGTIINNQNETNDLLKDSSTPTSSNVDSFFSGIKQLIPTNETISDLLLLPITLMTKLIYGIGSNCVPHQMEFFYNQPLTWPCIDLSRYLGATLWAMIDLMICGFMIYRIAMKMIQIYNAILIFNDTPLMKDLTGGGN